ncbi:hypothetical protein NRIC_28010 [Enterococcus florum]|uniref:Pentapeptide repeat-containing protein n=1 Tax=Enterococcus florum TaxID=2480627 RepID=A0A4P5PAD0_9ENTE|nr:pentapeptide repeat-containing protein [Enterococcus florum]GCF94910.1 hypothetical protein NRIC_28010 [Enterococcus florum]
MSAILTDHDYSYRNLPEANFHDIQFERVDFSHANLTKADFSNCLCIECDFSYAVLKEASFSSADLRGCNLQGADISGADMYFSMLEGANLTDLVYDDNTKYFKLYCPEEGPFLGYKKCFGFRIVQLLIPADARRTSATNNTCRCDKAKVLTIKDMYTNEDYDEAIAYADGSFVYRRGEWVEAKNFNPDRWVDSTGGINFFMTREEAESYL